MASPLLKSERMNNLGNLSSESERSSAVLTFWERIINDQELRDRTDLEKLLAGCEIIATLDRVDLLAA